MNQKRLTLFLLLVLSPLIIGHPVAAQTLLRVATPGALTGALPIYLGSKKGIFNKYGLSVEVIATRNEQMNMQALMSDSVQFLTSSSTGLFYLEDSVFASIPPYKFFDLSLIQELKSESR